MSELLSTGDVAKRIHIARHRIEYAISNGSLPDAKLRVANKRCFSLEELEGIAEYFGTKNNGSGKAAKGQQDEIDKEIPEPT